jgi:hypothetical protein
MLKDNFKYVSQIIFALLVTQTLNKSILFEAKMKEKVVNVKLTRKKVAFLLFENEVNC